jgi:prophage regulatory protein
MSQHETVPELLFPKQLSQLNNLPETGLVRLSQILGDKNKGIPPIIPVGKSTWWEGVKSGRYPKPIKLGERTTCWNVRDIRQLINQSEAG